MPWEDARSCSPQAHHRSDGQALYGVLREDRHCPGGCTPTSPRTPSPPLTPQHGWPGRVHPPPPRGLGEDGSVTPRSPAYSPHYARKSLPPALHVKGPNDTARSTPNSPSPSLKALHSWALNVPPQPPENIFGNGIVPPQTLVGVVAAGDGLHGNAVALKGIALPPSKPTLEYLRPASTTFDASPIARYTEDVKELVKERSAGSHQQKEVVSAQGGSPTYERAVGHNIQRGEALFVPVPKVRSSIRYEEAQTIDGQGTQLDAPNHTVRSIVTVTASTTGPSPSSEVLSRVPVAVSATRSRQKSRGSRRGGPLPVITRRMTRRRARRAGERAATVPVINVDDEQTVAVLRPPSKGDVAYENKATAAMEPPGNDRYRKADRKGEEILDTSLDKECASVATLKEYKRITGRMARTEAKRGLFGEGLFLKDDVETGSIIIEYTGNRICGRDLRRMNASFDHHGIHPDVQVAVPAERAVIDPRGVGNIAQKVNHHCRPNAKLEQIKVLDRWIVCIVALRDIVAGEEVFINYNYGRHNVFRSDEDGGDEEDETSEEEEEVHEFDMQMAATRRARLPIIICACDAANCCLTI